MANKKSLVVSEIMTPNKANFSGNIHGGHLMYMFDQVAYACAAQYAGHRIVTLSADRILFRKPVHIGDLVTCHASVNFVGNTTMEIGIRAEAHNLISGDKRHVISCYFTMVALDENGKPTPVPALEIANEIEQRRHDAAKKRREFNKKLF